MVCSAGKRIRIWIRNASIFIDNADNIFWCGIVESHGNQFQAEISKTKELATTYTKFLMSWSFLSITYRIYGLVSQSASQSFTHLEHLSLHILKNIRLVCRARCSFSNPIVNWMHFLLPALALEIFEEVFVCEFFDLSVFLLNILLHFSLYKFLKTKINASR